jgi:FO synthase
VEDEPVAPPITYSPKVFLPLTHLCRDACGYCTFAESPRRARAPYLDLDEVRAIARQGAAAGCHEALFTLGEAPEERYSEARAWLEERGYHSTIDYLVAACAAVLSDSGLLPHANAGAVSREDLLRLRAVSPSQGMMIESLNPDLPAHRGAPDKAPERRLATLEWAGELAIPFTTGILVGFGESRADRVEALEAIAASHLRHGHVQEVIVQNFMPKPGTAMRNSPACSLDDLIDAIGLARAILPADIAVQAPPNLVDDPGVLIAAGITDFGGISPVTADFVNPERPWPQIEHLRTITHLHERELVPRLTVHPAYVRSMDRWIAPELHTAVRDRSGRSAPRGVPPVGERGHGGGGGSRGSAIHRLVRRLRHARTDDPAGSFRLRGHRRGAERGGGRPGDRRRADGHPVRGTWPRSRSRCAFGRSDPCRCGR